MRIPACTIVPSSSPFSTVTTVESGESAIVYDSVESASAYLDRDKLRESHIVHFFGGATNYHAWLQFVVKVYPEVRFIVMNPEWIEQQSVTPVDDEAKRVRDYIVNGFRTPTNSANYPTVQERFFWRGSPELLRQLHSGS